MNWKKSMEYPPPSPKGSFFETDSPHHTDWYRFAQDLSPIHVGVYDIKNLVVETLKPKQPDYKGNLIFMVLIYNRKIYKYIYIYALTDLVREDVDG